MKTSSVVSVTPVGRGVVRNLTVFKNHTFITASGVVTHNCDHASPAFQAGFRNALESFSSNCSFILTCNNPNRIIEPIHSRCGKIDFKIPKEESQNLAGQLFKRVVSILNFENIEYDKRVVAELVKRHFPDFRRCLNELQKYSASGKIDSGILLKTGSETIDELITHLKEKKFNQMRQWVANNNDMDFNLVFRQFFDNANDKVEPKSIPELILTIADFQDKMTRSVDPEITITAFLTDIMLGNTAWK